MTEPGKEGEKRIGDRGRGDEGRRFELHNAITEGEGRETLREGMIVDKFLKPYLQRKNINLVSLAKHLLVFLPDIPLLVNLVPFLFSPSLPRGATVSNSLGGKRRRLHSHPRENKRGGGGGAGGGGPQS